MTKRVLLSKAEAERLADLAVETGTEIEIEVDGALIRIRPMPTHGGLRAYRGRCTQLKG